jgi:murein DD-endopeptidase MepM/ murein hydrolase activator NlpD
VSRRIASLFCVIVTLGALLGPAGGVALSQEADVEQAEVVDPYALTPVEPSVERAARSTGEAAAVEIRRRVRESAQARLDVATTGSAEALAKLTRILERLDQSVVSLTEAGAEIDSAQFEHRELVEDHRQAAIALDERLAALYTRGPTYGAEGLLEGYGFVNAMARSILLEVVLDGDQNRLVETYLAATTEVVDVASLAEDLRADSEDRDVLLSDRRDAIAAEVASAAELDGLVGLHDDLVFPIAGQYSFVDTFLAARMAGTRDVHRHQGIDIFAAEGTPLVALERGVVVKVGEVRLGGLRLWLIGESGTQYYYAHMSAFGEVSEGQAVEPGEVLGFVGHTGNARFTPPHVHFQVHPDGGSAVNGYPLLDALRDRDSGLVDDGGSPYGLCPSDDASLIEACSPSDGF